MGPRDRVNRWTAAVGLVGVPLLVFVLPPLLSSNDAVDAREQYTTMAQGSGSYGLLGLQIAGALCLVPACFGVLAVVAARGRGLVLAWIAAVVSALCAVSLLLALGMEAAMMYFLVESADKAATVDLALAFSRSPLFTITLMTGLAGVFLAPPIAVLALWRSRIVPVVVPALILLPLALGFVPLPEPAANLAPSFGLLLPSLWAAIALVVRRPAPAPRDRAPGPALQEVES